MRWLLVLLMLNGCIPFMGLHGAQPVPKGQVDLQTAAVVQTNTGDLSGLTMPMPVVGTRIGLGQDTDIGVSLMALGGGVDIRHRFYQRGKLHLATIPGVFVGYNGDSEFLSTDFRAPFVLEYAAGKNISLIVDARLVVREYWLLYDDPMGPGTFNRSEFFWGGGGRFDWHPKRFRLGVGAQVFHQPIDGGNLAVTLGLDMGVRIGKHPKPAEE